MKRIIVMKNCILALVIALALAVSSPALADKPAWAGSKAKGGKHGQKEKKDKNSPDINISVHFGNQQRTVIRNYYTELYRSGHCPPGLAKKNNRCMPPGQAKKWRVGRQLPRGVIFHHLPSALVVQLGPAPAGYRFVRVASDILLIAVGTGMVMDAIQDLNEIY